MYKSIWSSAGIDEFIKGGTACLIGGSLNLIYNLVFYKGMPNSVIIISSILIFILIMGTRLSYRIITRLSLYKKIKNYKNKKKTLIIGAGYCGQMVIEEIFNNEERNMLPVAIIDDDKKKLGKILRGIKVIGNRNDIKSIVDKENIEVILIAIFKISAKDKKEIIEICSETKAKVKILPGIYENIQGQVNINKMRDVDFKDLLGREEITLDKSGVEKYIKDKIVLVTGGGGSIGSELCRQIAKFSPKSLIILDIYENNVYNLQNELTRNFKELNKEIIIASVRDKIRMEKIFKKYKPDVVFHAAAHKHVPLMEGNPEEAIKNNVIGTLNTCEVSSKYGVSRFVLISTDKAVNPTNIMGATKRLCEMIVQGMNNSSKTEFVAVRFGNVLGSNGSVIPLFKEQIKSGGPVTITHKDITRYFMLIPEAAQLVLQAGAYAKGGEIFVLDMGSPVKIYDLAKKLIKLSGFEPNKDIYIEEIGLRPGEKLYEELLMKEEGLKATKNKSIFIGKPSKFNINDIKKNIEDLLTITLNEDNRALRMKMKEIVPTYVEIPKDTDRVLSKIM
ncbi:FlaA1/EpsC-like NDP-sugar epimerase [Clostridium moniliforme]|uniref:FlaA1/EpsC-like NDP-sugar epimerase n=2 Tax=Clostridium moniliforme TaxID=39489 RepID=A0ABS4EZA8_9CLOT|nr:FlaA1/EpsC-like NDP-sugar epimerase [Clostridium moniliforme]